MTKSMPCTDPNCPGRPTDPPNPVTHEASYWTRQLHGGGKARRWCVTCSCGWARHTNESGAHGRRLVRDMFEEHASAPEEERKP